MNELVLVKQTEFDGVELDCYVKPKQEDKGDFWATREQIGRLLEYEYPREAIGKIHERNKERLDKFSAVVKLTTPSGVQPTTLYSFKGLLEICRYSNQPKANDIMDWLFEVADEIRKTGSYSLRKRKTSKKPVLTLEIINAAEKIYHKALRCEDNFDVQEVLALDRLFKDFTGESALVIANFRLRCEDGDSEILSLEFKHPELQMLRLHNARIREMYNTAEYLNLMEEMRHERAD